MTDSFLIGTFVLFIVGSALSAAVTYRDCLAVRNVEGFIKWRQWFLVSSDAVQIGFLSFGIASIIQSRSDRVELSITWALQCTACTNVRHLVAFLAALTSQSVRLLQAIFSDTWWSSTVYVVLIPFIVLNGVTFLHM